MNYKKLANDYGKQYLSDEIPTAAITVLAYQEGFKKALEIVIDRVRYRRFSVVLRNDERTVGFIDACSTIQEEIEKLGKEQ